MRYASCVNHSTFLHRCLELAASARGKTQSNPMVGAVLVRGDSIIAEGVHVGFGAAHAERALLNNFDQKISSNDVLYVNLEPCCHHGKTPPCTEAIIAAGIRTVVFGMTDPDHRVAGEGIAALEAAGITVIGPADSERCRRFSRGYVSLRERGRPWITLKCAKKPDGSIASSDGSPIAITTDEQNAWSHAMLRARHDAILVGAGTVVTDDPLLSLRTGDAAIDQFQPLRIVLDPMLRTPVTARIVREGTLLITAQDRDAAAVRSYEDRGVRVMPFLSRERVFSLQALLQALGESSEYHPAIASILVEGGSRTWNHFRSCGLVDEEILLAGA